MGDGTVLSEAARAFLDCVALDILAVAYPTSGDAEKCRAALLSDPSVKKSVRGNGTKLIFAEGGKTRQDSVLNALEKIGGIWKNESKKIVLIHDGARPFVSRSIIEETVRAAAEFGAAVPGIEPTDTQKEIDGAGFIKKHLVRSNLRAVQTPQGFSFPEILEAHRKAREIGKNFTDDTEIWDLFSDSGRRVKVVPGDAENRKITYRSDFSAENPKNPVKNSMEDSAENQKGCGNAIRTGLGYDKHLLVTGRKLVLGGVSIPSERGEAGHSDGDALLHAITDAILGASALGDIGSYFPPEEPKWKDADSKTLLARCWSDVRKKGWKIGNLDCVVALEKPKFLPHRQEVRESIAKILGCETEKIFVKAKTGEGTGEIGEGRAVEAWCVCLLER